MDMVFSLKSKIESQQQEIDDLKKEIKEILIVMNFMKETLVELMEKKKC